MDRAAVIGFPVEHSLSPKIFAVIAECLFYEKISVPPEKLQSFVEANQGNYVGWNVTVPHKEAIIPLLSELSLEAEEIGAVNVVHGTKGYNTDYLGVIETLREHEVDIRRKNVLIYGAGGAARAVRYACSKLGAAKIYVYNRTPGRGMDLGIRIDCVDQAEDAISLLVSATPAAVHPLPKYLTENAKGFNLLYYSEADPFAGISTLKGLDMLVWQAIYTFEIWFGPLKNKQELKRGILSKISI